MKPPLIRLTSDTPRLCQYVLRSPVARRRANTLPTEAAQIPMALRRHERNFATRSVHTLEANISHETPNDPAFLTRQNNEAASLQNALSPAFRALDPNDLRKGLRRNRTNRTLACISRTRHARSAQSVARGPDTSHSRLHFAHSTRAISAEGCAGTGQIALSPAFRALDTHDLARTGQIALSPAFRALPRTISAEGCVLS